MKSMTGFGRSEYKNEKLDCQIDIKSVNNRYKDIYIRIPSQYSFLDNKIRNLISQKINRGKLDTFVTISFKDTGNNAIELNKPLAKNYINVLNELMGLNTMINTSIDLSLLANIPDLIKTNKNAIEDDELWSYVEIALNNALDDLIESRAKEGSNLKQDLELHLENSETILTKIKEIEPYAFTESKEKLRKRIEELLEEVKIDEDRFLNEVAILSDKLAIDEEISRLESHINRFKELKESEEPIGRKLDFLIQEMNRETNTIGSKTDNIQIKDLTVDLKSEIEKLREQIQNIE